MSRIITLASFLIVLVGTSLCAQEHDHSVARQWNEAVLNGIRNDFARPTIHARNLFHSSSMMYDLWAVFDENADTYFLGNSIRGFEFTFDGFPTPEDIQAAREEAISYSVYRLMKFRFQNSPGYADIIIYNDSLMQELGYDPNFESINYSSGNAAALGNYLALKVIEFGLEDGSNELFDFLNFVYLPVNRPLIMDNPGNPDIVDLNRWQPLSLETFIDQAGNPTSGTTPDFLSPEWGWVIPFAMQPEDVDFYDRDGGSWAVYHDPGPPPYLDTNTVGGLSEEYKWGFALVSAWSSHLDARDTTMWDISPASIGNNPELPTNFFDHRQFYDLENGGDASLGHTINPYTGQPYPAQMVPRADYARVLAEFWADGPDSETPPGHWFTILNYVNDQPEFERRYRGEGDILDPLEWDVKAYFMMGGTMHDCAISAWGIKGYYDYIRPVSAIRGMAELGQSTDTSLVNYHPGGIPLIEGYVGVVSFDDVVAGDFGLGDVNKIKIYAWKGPEFIDDPETDEAGVDWILAEDWWPYQRPTFVTPPFAGYVSGHSTYSRGAAEVLTLLTGDPFFPGGVGEFPVKKNEFLVFEEGPSVDFTLQWATYRDASDQTSLSRIWGGIHPPADDIPGRLIGEVVGIDAFNYAEQYFNLNVVNTSEEIAEVNRFEVFPNPVSNDLIIKSEQGAEVQITLFNQLGQPMITKERIFVQSGRYLDLSNLPEGVYWLEIKDINAKFRQVEKVVKGIR